MTQQPTTPDPVTPDPASPDPVTADPVNVPQISILPARRADLGAIMALERDGFGPEEQWSERSWLGELIGDSRTVLIARAHHPVGVITLQNVDRSADLLRLVVAARHRRQGIGFALIRAGMLAVHHRGARSVLLEVGFDNEPAIAAYQRFGFEQLAARENYYGPGRHALILKFWDLPRWAAEQLANQPTDDGRAELV
jgi:ribosomal-protein-alanine N-acetyltransferase